MTINQAAKSALALQDGCNASGIARTLHEIFTEALWPAARESGHGTQWVNQHPIVTLILDKLTDLNHRADFSSAYRDVKALAGQPLTEPHPKVLHGKCDQCGHYGEDCTGIDSEQPAAPKPILVCRFCGQPECICGSPEPAADTGWLCRYCHNCEADCLCDDDSDCSPSGPIG